MVLATTDPTIVTDAMAEIQAAAGLRRISISALLQQGVLVDLTIRRWRAAVSLDLDDLGVAVTDDAARSAIQQFMTLGTKRLLPPKVRRELERAESTGRRALEKHSYATAWGRFVPATAYAAWKKANAEAQAEYSRLRDELVARYAAIVAEVLREYQAAAGQAYVNLARSDASAVTAFPDQAAFVAAYCAKIRTAIPRPEEIRASFVYAIKLDRVSLPEAEAAAVTADAGTAAQAAMNQDLIAELRQRKAAEIDEFLIGMVAQLRMLMYEVATDVLAALQRNERLPRNSSKQLKRLVTQITALNFYGDTDVTQMLTQLQGIIKTPAKQRNLRELEETMRAVATVSRSTLLQVGAAPRSGRAVEVPDAPTSGEVRRARTILNFQGIDGDDPLLGEVRRQRRPAQISFFADTGDS